MPAPKAIAPISALTAVATSPHSRVQLTWTDNDTTATGYTILRATDDVHFASIATVDSATATTPAPDSTALPATGYEYEIQAFNTATTAAAFFSFQHYNAAWIAVVSALTALSTSPTHRSAQLDQRQQHRHRHRRPTFH